VVERDARRDGHRLEVGVVGDDGADLRAQVAGPHPVDQLLQHVVGAADEDRQARPVHGLHQPPGHRPLTGQRRQPRLELGTALRQPGEQELQAQGEGAPAGVGAVLLRVDDVRPEPGEEPADGRHDAGAVRAADDEPADVGEPVVGVRQGGGGHGRE
jgi:hypothetical protein